MDPFAKLIKPIQRPRISAEIVQQIKSFFVNKNLRVGDRLPSERQLSLLFSVGRPMVREALRSLEMVGLIEVQQGKGAFVRDLDFGSYIKTLKENANLMVFSDSVSLEEFYGGRKLIEPGIARLVAETRTAQDLLGLEKIVVSTRKSIHEGRRFIKYAAVFHEEMARMTGNKVIQFAMDFILTLSPQARLKRFSRKAFRELVLWDHEQILDRVRRQDGEGAGWEMEKHLDHLVSGRAAD
jgi:DNA-binding FadR family transcriptional regulator